ncbi:MAG TPA: phosphate propanoyltransferase [Peptococcaceae bacterium]|nr:MAG: Phosphate propanoyltransferase [Moorella sp. 60_41]HBT46840.1 phosphate propanoyltransferase [Peptococcaceae bacterium]
MSNAALVELITREILAELEARRGKTSARTAPTGTAKRVPVAVSARHVHLSQKEIDILFGPGYQLTKRNDLYQPGEFAANEVVTLVGPKLRPLTNVRVLGPVRDRTQVEISRTDAIYLGIDAPVRRSGDLAGSAPITLVGPKGSVTLPEGAIIANRHIHMSPKDAARWGLKDNDEVTVRTVNSERPTIFGGVQVRVSPKFRLVMHIDTDDANAAGLRCNDEVEIR